jgi:chromosome segregation ATPase
MRLPHPLFSFVIAVALVLPAHSYGREAVDDDAAVIARLKEQVAKLEVELKQRKSSVLIGRDGTVINRHADELQGLRNERDGLTSKVDGLTTEVGDLKQKLAEAAKKPEEPQLRRIVRRVAPDKSAEVGKLKTRVTELEKERAELSSKFDDLSKERAELSRKLDELSQERGAAAESAEPVEELKGVISQLKLEAQEAKDKAQTAEDEAKTAKGEAASLKAQVQRLTSQLELQPGTEDVARAERLVAQRTEENTALQHKLTKFQGMLFQKNAQLAQLQRTSSMGQMAMRNQAWQQMSGNQLRMALSQMAKQLDDLEDEVTPLEAEARRVSDLVADIENDVDGALRSVEQQKLLSMIGGGAKAAAQPLQATTAVLRQQLARERMTLSNQIRSRDMRIAAMVQQIRGLGGRVSQDVQRHASGKEQIEKLTEELEEAKEELKEFKEQKDVFVKRQGTEQMHRGNIENFASQQKHLADRFRAALAQTQQQYQVLQQRYAAELAQHAGVNEELKKSSDALGEAVIKLEGVPREIEELEDKIEKISERAPAYASQREQIAALELRLASARQQGGQAQGAVIARANQQMAEMRRANAALRMQLSAAMNQRSALNRKLEQAKRDLLARERDLEDKLEEAERREEKSVLQGFMDKLKGGSKQQTEPRAASQRGGEIRRDRTMTGYAQGIRAFLPVTRRGSSVIPTRSVSPAQKTRHNARALATQLEKYVLPGRPLSTIRTNDLSKYPNYNRVISDLMRELPQLLALFHDGIGFLVSPGNSSRSDRRQLKKHLTKAMRTMAGLLDGLDLSLAATAQAAGSPQIIRQHIETLTSEVARLDSNTFPDGVAITKNLEAAYQKLGQPRLPAMRSGGGSSRLGDVMRQQAQPIAAR